MTDGKFGAPILFATGLLLQAVTAAAQAPAPTSVGVQTPDVATAAVLQCAQSHPLATDTIEAAEQRIEAARQTNSAAAMRAAIDDLQSALRQLRVQIAPCANIQPAADPHAGHVMPAAETAAPAQAAPAGPPPPPASAAAAPPPASAAPRPQTAPAPARPAAPTITFRSTPNPARGAASNQFEVVVRDGQGRPIDGADVTVQFYMPAMPAMRMGEMRSEIMLAGAGNGRYAGAGQVAMAGSWTVTITVRQNGRQIGQQRVTLTAR